MRIDLADEETPGLGLCAEFIWVKVVILIDRRHQCDWRLSWWIRFIMVWSLDMNYCSRASPVVKLSLLFSRMDCLAMEAQRTITMSTACSNMSLLVNDFAYNVPGSYMCPQKVFKRWQEPVCLNSPSTLSIKTYCGSAYPYRRWGSI